MKQRVMPTKTLKCFKLIFTYDPLWSLLPNELIEHIRILLEEEIVIYYADTDSIMLNQGTDFCEEEFYLEKTFNFTIGKKKYISQK
jgi:hypothetical protein